MATPTTPAPQSNSTSTSSSIPPVSPPRAPPPAIRIPGSPFDDWSAVGSLSPTQRRDLGYAPSLLSSGFSPTTHFRQPMWVQPINTNFPIPTSGALPSISIGTSLGGSAFGPVSPDSDFQVVIYFGFLLWSINIFFPRCLNKMSNRFLPMGETYRK